MKISRYCYAITGLAFIPPWTVNAGFIAGDVATLVVDTGTTMQAARTIYGYASCARPGNRLLVINTERHLDHVSGNSLFRDLGCDIYGHPGIHRQEEELVGAIAELNACIPNTVRRENEEARVFYQNTHIANPNQFIEGEMRLDLGSFSVQVFPTPGHTLTNISVFAPIDSVLYCGDCLVSAYLPNLEDGAPELWQNWLNSLERIETLAPAVVVPGHGEVLRGAEITAEIQRTRQVLQQALATGQAPTLVQP
jgi:glyoxylase-like metal-dependent hydrolase (beta-lactamase superfamily II)